MNLVVSKRNRWSRVLVPCLPVLVLGIAAVATHGPAAHAAGVTVTYPAGWNLVGGPDGTVYNASGSTYTIGSGDASYVSNPGTAPIAGGKGYWAFFPADTTVTLNGAGLATVLRVSVPAGQYVMVGNPSGTQSALVGGDADQVLTYDAAAGRYNLTTTLGLGQGAWVLSNNGGTVTLTASGPAQSIPTDTGGGLPAPAPAPTGLATPAASGGNSGGMCTSGPRCQVLEIEVGVDAAHTNLGPNFRGQLAVVIQAYSFGKPAPGIAVATSVSSALIPGAISDVLVTDLNGSATETFTAPPLPAGTTIMINAAGALNGFVTTAQTTYKTH